jgi:DNA-binding NarL/FixJ family response regulator
VAGGVTTYTAVIADDHAIVRIGIRGLLQALPEVAVLDEADDGMEAVDLVARLKPDLLVCDLVMPELDGLGVIRQVRERSPQTRVVVLSMHADEGHALEAFRAGAIAYVLKHDLGDGFLTAIRYALQDRRYLSPPLSEHALDAYAAVVAGKARDPYATLSMREREVLHLVGQGLSYKAIAQRLQIGLRTVHTHAEAMREKLGLKSRDEVIRFALEREQRLAGGHTGPGSSGGHSGAGGDGGTAAFD